MDKKITPSSRRDKDVAAAFVKGGSGPGRQDEQNAGRQAPLQRPRRLPDLDVFNEEYAEQTKAAHEGADEHLKKLEDTVGKAQKSQFEMAEEDGRPRSSRPSRTARALVTAGSRPGGVACTPGGVAFRHADGRRLKGSKQTRFKDLSKLPAGQVFYVGMEIGPELAQSLGSVLTGLAADADSAGAKAMAEALSEWSKSARPSRSAASNIPLSGLQIEKWDPEKTLAASLKMFKAMGAAGRFPERPPQGKARSQSRRPRSTGTSSFTSVHMVFDWEKTMEAAGGGEGVLPDAAKKQMVEGMKNSWATA